MSQLEDDLIRIIKDYADDVGVPEKLIPELLRVIAARYQLTLDVERLQLEENIAHSLRNF